MCWGDVGSSRVYDISNRNQMCSLYYRITIPESWARYTQENIARSQKERACSERLRGEIDGTLRQCANDMWNMFNGVNNGFNARIRETTDARNRLQAHLQRVRFYYIIIYNHMLT